MEYDQAIKQLVDQGAIRIARMSAVWHIAYRSNEGQVEARGMHRVGDTWMLADHMPSPKASPTGDGWFLVKAVPPNAKPVESKQAERNEGYFAGLTRQCYTCKQERPISWFSHADSAEGQYRSWECRQCAAERAGEQRTLRRREDEHLGDYMKERSAASRPPVASEI